VVASGFGALDRLALSGGTLTGELVAPDVNIAGLTGATAASRYVGATTSGAPASGTFLKGDFVIDQTAKVWVCTTTGSPGTWTQAGGSPNSLPVFNVLNTAYSGGADPSGSSDSTLAINAAIAACISGSPVPGGVVYLPPGTYKVTGNLTCHTTVPVYIRGAGRWATTINFTGTGDCLRVYDSSNINTRTRHGGGVEALTIDGTGSTGSGACGLHMGDIFEFRLDVGVQNFFGTGGIGVHLDNQWWWTEQLSGQVFAANCATHVMLDQLPAGANKTTATGSFARLDLAVYVDQDQAAFDGVTLANGAFVYDGRLAIRGNFGSSSSAVTSAALRITGQTDPSFTSQTVSSIFSSRLDVQVECEAGAHTPQTIVQGTPAANYIRGCDGILDFAGGGVNFTQSNLGSPQAPGALWFLGPISGDASLSPATVPSGSGSPLVVCGSLVYTAGYANPGTTSTLFSYGADFFELTLASNTTISFADGFGQTLGAPQRITVMITQSASASFTVTWPTSGSPSVTAPTVLWAGGGQPTMNPAHGSTDTYMLETADGATWFGYAIQQKPLGVAQGGTGLASLTAYAPLTGGTTSTGALQQATTGMSTSGHVLTSTGASSLPTWQAPSGGGDTAASATWSTGTPTISIATADVWDITISHNITGLTITPTAANVQTVSLFLNQDGTGNWTFPSSAWPGSVTWLAGGPPVINPAASSLTLVVLETYNAGSTWYGSVPAPSLPVSVVNGGTGLSATGAAGALLTSTGTTTAPAWQGLLPLTAVQTSSFNVTASEMNPVDATAGNVTATLPTGVIAGDPTGIKLINTASGHTLTVQTTAPDVLGRVTGFTSGSYSTSMTPFALPGQGTLLIYTPAGAAWAVTATSGGSANIVTSVSGTPFATGEIVYLSGTTAPAGLSLNTPYYVVSATGSQTFQLSATSTGSGITLTSTGTTCFAQTAGFWTVLSDDLPLAQLETLFAQTANNLSDLASASTSRTNLGLGSAATLASSAVAQTANNLSDLASASTALTNLGALPTAGGTMSGAIAMGASKVTGLGAGSAPADAVNVGQVAGIGANAAATSAVSVGISAGEMVIATVTMPSGMSAQATWRLTAWGTISIGTTGGTITVRTRVGGLSGSLLSTEVSAAQTASNTGGFRFTGEVTLQTTGSSGTWSGSLVPLFALGSTAGVAGTNGPTCGYPESPPTLTSLTTQAFVITIQLGSATSTASCLGSLAERII